MLGAQFIRQVKHKSNVLSLWVSKDYAKQVEVLSEKKLLNHSIEVLQRFLGKKYNVTRPIAIMRSQWYTNKNFIGTYSFTSVKAQRNNLDIRTLEEPLVPQNMVKNFLF